MYYTIQSNTPLPPNLFEISSLVQVDLTTLKVQGTAGLARLIHDAAAEVINTLREQVAQQGSCIIVTPLQVLAADDPGGTVKEHTGETNEEGEDILRTIYNQDGTPMMREPTIGYSAFCTVAFQAHPDAVPEEPAWMTLPTLAGLDTSTLTGINWKDAAARHRLITHVLPQIQPHTIVFNALLSVKRRY